ncbi:MAG TPA: Rpn family recombination-promoting nuclease/putative transposase, partial [Acetivibrio sp.]|nr:Rpn family recombination-promoting nuclease/putative transposase [Acetivibrio sp.]
MPEERINKEHDLGYKHLLTHKKTFIQLLRSFVKEDWVNEIDESQVMLVDKSYILQDFREKESDIVYRLKIKDRNVIFYCLLELQSSVDYQMPIRLLFYMIEIWRDILKNTENHKIE